jgi:hypothetical protein
MRQDIAIIPLPNLLPVVQQDRKMEDKPMKAMSLIAMFVLVSSFSTAHADTVEQVCSTIYKNCDFGDQMECLALQEESERGYVFDPVATDVCMSMSHVCRATQSPPATDCLEAIEGKTFSSPSEISPCAQLADAGKFDAAISCLENAN